MADLVFNVGSGDKWNRAHEILREQVTALATRDEAGLISATVKAAYAELAADNELMANFVHAAAQLVLGFAIAGVSVVDPEAWDAMSPDERDVEVDEFLRDNFPRIAAFIDRRSAPPDA